MVSVESGAFGRRFRLLETMRQFGAEHLSAMALTDQTAARHAAFVQAEVARLGPLLYSNAEIEGAIRLAELWPNVRVAVDWALTVRDRHLAAEILRPIAFQLFVRRGLDEIAEWAKRLLAITPPDDEEMLGSGSVVGRHAIFDDPGPRGFKKLFRSAGPPDHIFARYAYLIGVEDNDFAALRRWPTGCSGNAQSRPGVARSTGRGVHGSRPHDLGSGR